MYDKSAQGISRQSFFKIKVYNNILNVYKNPCTFMLNTHFETFKKSLAKISIFLKNNMDFKK